MSGNLPARGAGLTDTSARGRRVGATRSVPFCSGRTCTEINLVNLDNYLPVLLFIGVGIVVGVAPQILGRLLAPHRPDAEKNSAYECGFEAFEDARMKYDVRYYLVAILFILFDLEVAFLVPWAVAMSDVGLLGFWAMMIFLGVLVVGLIFEWKKGALDWE